MKKPKGIIAPIVTPYDNHGRINRVVAAELTAYLVGQGLDGILVCGSTGEFPVLSTDERKTMAEAVVAGAKNADVMINVSSMQIEESISLIEHAVAIGANAITVVAPYYFNYDDEAMLSYFSYICKRAQDLPVYLYNIPQNTKNPITTQLLARICEHCPNIVGIKDSSMDFMVLLDYLYNSNPDFLVMTGNDAQVLHALQAGASGAVVACAGIVPNIAKGIKTDYLAGNLESARDKQLTLHRLRTLFRKLMPVVSHKQALEYLGFPMGQPRLPFRPLTDIEKRELITGLDQLGLKRR